ncbi:HAMP domain-containing protein [Rhodopseudomonas sp. P2A-2r]|uniref:HAMP domain-containing protein n=1 Tax=Rhodopseudomonas sp. P2A-2r TaxID=2991972 RepID=UPI0022344AC4|nr:HAMP domain-containing sensor histidine kinase [Rhodopseudomonas sp. P2A-2r]UZE52151.1 HAMP domain-containing protein [Rhodopseudomonas sp. P2A-2r]
MADIVRQFEDTRAFTAAQMQRAIDQRGDAANELTVKVAAVTAAVGGLMREQELQIQMQDGATARFIQVASAVMELRDSGGRQAGMLQNIVGAHKPPAEAERALLLTLQGCIDHIWDSLVTLEGAPSTPAALDQAVRGIHETYINGYGAERRMLVGHFATGDFPYGAADYNLKVGPMWKTLIALRDAAYDSAATTIADERADAWRQLALAAAVVLMVIVVVAGVVVLVVRRITKPILHLTASIERVASGDLAPDIRYDAWRDEIGVLSRAIGVLQQRSMEARRLEAKQAAERHARERRTVHLEQLVSAFEATVGSLVEILTTRAEDIATSGASDGRGEPLRHRSSRSLTCRRL